MNAKTAKKLRRIAAQVTVGKPWQSYTWWLNRGVLGGSVSLTIGCTKQVYKDLKKTVRDARAGQPISL